MIWNGRQRVRHVRCLQSVRSLRLDGRAAGAAVGVATFRYYDHRLLPDVVDDRGGVQHGYSQHRPPHFGQYGTLGTHCSSFSFARSDI